MITFFQHKCIHVDLRRIVAVAALCALFFAGLTPEFTRAGSDTFENEKTGRNNPHVGVVGDPLLTHVGEYGFEIPLFQMGTGPMPIDLRFIYASFMDFLSGTYSKFFFFYDAATHSYHVSLLVNPDDTDHIGVFLAGRQILFQKVGGVWQLRAPEETAFQLLEDAANFYLMDPVKELVYTLEKFNTGFQDRGMLTRIEDRVFLPLITKP